jgi:hypothetical protein
MDTVVQITKREEEKGGEERGGEDLSLNLAIVDKN